MLCNYYVGFVVVEFVSPVDLKQAGNWLKFNKNNTGYYKVRYPQAWWEKLGTLLKNDIEVIHLACILEV